jgi:hypothetical protein
MHAANAVKLGFCDGVESDVVEGVSVSRLATEGDLELPPHPAVRSPSATASAARPSTPLRNPTALKRV